MVVVGPVSGSETQPREFEAFPTQEVETVAPFSLRVADSTDLLPRLLGSFRGLFQQTPLLNGFELDVAGGRFSFRAALPGYGRQPGRLEASADRELESRLSVQIIGRTLVVRGLRSVGDQLVSVFQRSFQLPEGANLDEASAVYAPEGEMLTVEMPSLPGAAAIERHEARWMYDPQDGGSHTSLTFSADTVQRALPSLRGVAKTLEEDLGPLLRRTLEYAKALSDPNLGYLDVGAQVASVSLTTTPSPAVLVQPKHAMPYWRLVEAIGADSGSRALEIVAPWGTDLGSPEGTVVPMFNATTATQISRPRIGHIELPVAVGSSGCTWIGSSSEGADSLDRMLRCALGPDVVRNVQIKFAQEL